MVVMTNGIKFQMCVTPPVRLSANLSQNLYILMKLRISVPWHCEEVCIADG